MKGYLIEKYSDMGVAYTSDRLIQEAAKAGVVLDRIGVHDVLLTGDGPFHKGQALKRRDFVLNRYKWGWIKDKLNSLGDESYNRLKPFNRFIDKYEQLQRLDSRFFQKPHYVLGTIQSSYDAVASLLGDVFVVKGLRNSKGKEIYLVHSPSEFKRLQDFFPLETELLFEEFIASSFGRDLRLFCIRGEAIAAMIRKSNGDFRSNFALGASVQAVPVTGEMRTIAEDLFVETGLDVMGVDLLFGQDGYYLCEINVTPGIEGIEAATGSNIASLIISLIVNDLKSK
ncbi:MAG: hypothetical protein IJQ69_06655 [Bacteroidales bacterium]|nr:hypothetical protein [Bacteroidales bacterium]